MSVCDQRARDERPLLEERRQNPQNDIVSSVATAEVDSERLTVEELCMFWLLLTVAATRPLETPSGGIIALLQHGLWKPLAVDVAAGRREVDQKITGELARYISPVMTFRRTATRDVESDGQQVRAGDKVVLWYGAANRDPKHYDDPHRLDLDRDNTYHLGFGIGPRFCLGTRLARLQISTLLTELLTRFPDMRLDGEPTWVGSTFINGIEHLPVKVTQPTSTMDRTSALQMLALAATGPDRLAVICDDGQQLTYGELADRAVRLAGALRGLGLDEGSVVAILHENAPAYLEIAWACRLAAIYHVTLNTNLGADEIAYILNDSGAEAIIASANLSATSALDAIEASRLRHRVLRTATGTGSAGPPTRRCSRRRRRSSATPPSRATSCRTPRGRPAAARPARRRTFALHRSTTRLRSCGRSRCCGWAPPWWS